MSPGHATQVADDLAHLLDSFMAELASAPEPSCAKNGQRIQLADNVVLTVSGDSPKNSFDVGWPDGAPGLANWIYVLSNGYMQPGWFGKVRSTGKTNFNPVTGDDAPMASDQEVTSAALAAVLYAVARGDGGAVNRFYTGPYQGLVVTPP